MSTLTAPSATEQFRSKANDVKETLMDMGALAPEAAREKYAELRQSATDACDRTRERAGEAKDSVEEYIRERPIQCVLMAAGAGLLIGYLLKRSR